MDISEAFEEIMQHAHYFNWVPDLQVTKEIYEAFPNSFSVLTPFAYTYLEELIRSTTSEYGSELYDENGMPKRRSVGMKLVKLAIAENRDKNPKLIKLLKEIKGYFVPSAITDEGDNRNSVVHGYMHPRFWNKESFEKLIFDIVKLSEYSGF